MTLRAPLLPVAVTFAILAVASAAAAEDPPSWFVTPDKCPSRPCTCADIPMMEKVDANQTNARDIWKGVQKDVLTPTGPKSGPAAIALFMNRFVGDPAVNAQFQTCPGYDSTKNNLSKVAGVSGIGQPVLDPCYCAAFCQDVVDATVAHEKMHVPTIILGVVGKSDVVVACGLGIAKGGICDALAPYTLAGSEIVSYDTGIAALEASIDKLKASDPSMPSMACTWMPIAEPATSLPPAPPPPSGFVDRVRLLFDRIVHGARQ